MKTYIYTLEDSVTHEIRYVGKTVNLKKRFSSYTCKAYLKSMGNIHLKNWLLKIYNGEATLVMSTIDEIEDINWQRVEQYWISQFKCWGFRLLNITEGGEGSYGYKHSMESLNKMASWKRVMTDEWRRNIANGQRGIPKKFNPNRKTNKGMTWELHKFTFEECKTMVNLYKEGLSFRKISRKFNSNHKTISKIIRNEKYNN